MLCVLWQFEHDPEDPTDQVSSTACANAGFLSVLVRMLGLMFRTSVMCLSLVCLQCELFLIKNPDVTRDQIKGLLEDFLRFCKPDNTTTLEVGGGHMPVTLLDARLKALLVTDLSEILHVNLQQARFLMMLESRGETKTASEVCGQCFDLPECRP